MDGRWCALVGLRPLSADRLTVLGGVGVTALWASFWWPVLGRQQVLLARDLPLFALPTKYYWRERVLAGEVPAWIPSVDGGSPFLADAGYQALYPPNLLLLLDLPLPVAMSWFMAAHFLAGALGMFALARVVGAGPAVAAWVGAAYGLCGYPLAVADNITYVAGVAWVPCVLAALLAALRHGDRRWLALAAAFLALLLLAGDVLDAAIAATVCAVAGLVRAVRALQAGDARLAAGVSLLTVLLPVLAVLLAAAQVLPTLELLPLTSRALPLPDAMRGAWSLPPLRIAELLHPYVFDAKWPEQDYLMPALYPGPHNPWAESINLGPAVIGTALAALLLRTRLVAGWATLVLVMLVLATSGNFPALLELTSHVPVLASQRYFEKLVLWVSVGLLAMAAVGARTLFDAHSESMPRAPLTRLALAAALILAFWMALDAPLGAVPDERAGGVSPYWSAHFPALVTVVGGSLLHAALWIPLIAACVLVRGVSRRVVLAVVLLVSLGDLYWLHEGRYLSAPAALADDQRNPVVVDAVESLDPGSLRTARVYYDNAVPGNDVWVDDSPIAARVAAALADAGGYQVGVSFNLYRTLFLRERVTPIAGIRFGVRYLNGDWSPLRSRAIELMERQLLDDDPALLLELGGVRWVVTAATPINALWEQAGLQEALLRPELNLRVMRVPRSAPRTWLSRRSEVTTPARDYLQPAGMTRVIEQTPELIRISVDAGTDARWLIVNESLMPGWRASVDGRYAEPVAAHGRYIGVGVEAGRHEVVLEYRTPGLVAGSVLSALGLLGMIALCLRPGRGWHR